MQGRWRQLTGLHLKLQYSLLLLLGRQGRVILNFLSSRLYIGSKLIRRDLMMTAADEEQSRRDDRQNHRE